MPEIAEFEIIGKTDQAVKNVNKLNNEIEKTKKTTKKAKDEMSGMQQIGDKALGELDKRSGGLASKLVAVGKAARLSGKAMKTALISSGIGAAIVGIGLIVEYWDQIGEALGFINKDLENQAIEINKSVDASNVKLASLKNQQTILELQDKSSVKIKDAIKEELLYQVQKNVELLKNLQTQLELEKNSRKEITLLEQAAFWVGTRLGSTTALAYASRNVQKENEKELEIQEEINKATTQAETLKISLLQIDKKANDEKQKAIEFANNEAKKLAEKNAQDQATAIEEIAKLEDEYFQSKLDKQTQEENAVYDKYYALIEAAKQYGLDTTELEAARQSELDLINKTFTEKAEQDEQDRLDAIKKIQDNHKELTDVEKLEQQQAEALAELKLLEATEDEKLAIIKYYAGQIKDVKDENAKEDKKISQELLKQGLGDAQATFDMVGKLAGEDSKVGKAMAIASATISGVQGVMNAFTTASASPITTFFPAYPFVQSGLAGALALKNIASIKSIDPSGKGNTGSVPSQSGGGGAAPTPPAFNVVGQSGTNQLADAIGGQSQRPSRAYVVSNDVTTSQELERNIIEGASIG